jgi:hypothetical protein
MSTPTSLQIPAEHAGQPAPGSLPVRLGQLFFAPGKLFESFREQAPWAGTLVALLGAILCIQLIVFFTVPDDVFADYIRQAIADQGGQVPPDEQLMAGIKIQKMVGVVAGPIMTALSALLSAAVMWVMFTVIAGGKARYGQYMAIVAHAMFIAVVGALVTLPLMLNTGNLEIALSPALFLSEEVKRTTFLYMALNKLDVFNLWTMVVAGIGVAAVNRTRSWPLYSVAMMTVYVLLTAGVSAVLAAVMSSGQPS